MRVRICTFARNGAESELGPDLAETVRTALSHYSDKLRSGRPPLPPPRFVVGAKRKDGVEALELSIAPEVERALKREAALQGVDLDTLADHSVLVYLAELDFLGAPLRLV